jgi:hypothetical protein
MKASSIFVLIDDGPLGDKEREFSGRIKIEFLVQQALGNSTLIELIYQESRRIFTILLTDDASKLESPFRRRFERRLCVNLPSKEERILLLEKFLDGNWNLSKTDIGVIAEKTEKFTRGDLFQVVQYINSNNPDMIQIEIMLSTFQITCTEKMLIDLNTFLEQYG